MPILGSFGAGSAKSFGFTGGGLPPGIVANGGTLSYDGDYGINLFAASGDFVVEKLGDNGDDQVEYLVVAGGGNGSHAGSAGGGGAEAIEPTVLTT